MILQDILDYSRLSCSLLAAAVSLVAPWRPDRRISPIRGLIWACYAQLITIWTDAIVIWTLSIQQDSSTVPAWSGVLFAVAAVFQAEELSADSTRVWTLYNWAWCLGSISEVMGIMRVVIARELRVLELFYLFAASLKLVLYVFLLGRVFFGKKHRYNRLPQDDTGAPSENDETRLEIVHKSETNMWDWIKQLRVFWRFMWPSDNLNMKVRLLSTLLLNLGLEGLAIWTPQAFGRLIDELAHGGTWVSIGKILMFWIVSQVLEFLSSKLHTRLWLTLSAYRAEELDKTVFAKVMNADRSFHANKSSTDLMTSVDKAQGVERSFDGLMTNALDLSFAMCVTMPVTAYKFGQHVMIVMMIRLVLAYLNFKRGLVKALRANAEFMAVHQEHRQSQQDTISGHETASVFGCIADQIAKNDTGVGQLHEAKFRYHLKGFAAWVYGTAAGEVSYTIGVLLLCKQIFVGASTAGDLAVYTSYWKRTLNPILSILKEFQEIAIVFKNAEKVADIMDMVPKERGRENLKVTQGAIEFRNVNFSRGSKMVLQSFDLYIPPTKKIAFVGPSGVGKSTILNLLAGQIEPDSGEILVDGQDITKVDSESISDQIGILQQDPHIYDATIKYNLLIGKRDATMEEIHEACMKARIHDVIMGRPEGYDTRCGVGGKTLSGGEVQRMAIARLFLKKPKVVLIDEGTSALDAATEGFIKRSFSETFKPQTMVTVTHRLSTVRQADEIIVLGDKGSIVERGSHDALLKLKGEYSRYWGEHLGEHMPIESQDTLS